MSGSNFVHVGGTPHDEPCAQIGKTQEAGRWNRLECRAYIAALVLRYGDPAQTGCEFRTLGQPHDYETYYEVVCHFSPNISGSIAYAMRAESGMATWADAGMRAPVLYDPVTAQAMLALFEPVSWSALSAIPYAVIAA